MSIEDVKDAEDRRLNKGQVGMLKWIWRAVDEFFGPHANVRDLTYDKVSAYVAHRRAAGIRGQSIRRELSALRRISRRAIDRGWLGQMLMEWPRVKNDPSDERRRGKLHPSEKIREVLAMLPVDVRDEYTFAALTGLRRGELSRVAYSWMEGSAAGPILRVPASASKTRTERIVALSAPAVEILNRRAELVPVFGCARHWSRLQTASRRAGLRLPVTMRDLRTYFATIGLVGSGDAAAVQAAMGHSDLAMTQTYQRTTLERAAKVSEAAAAGIANAVTPGRHTRKKRSDSASAESDTLCGWQLTTLHSEHLSCAECRAVLEAHANGRHRSVGTPVRRAA